MTVDNWPKALGRVLWWLVDWLHTVTLVTALLVLVALMATN